MDLDNNGTLDILTGCYWTSKAEAAHFQILYGEGGNDFSEPITLVSDSGEPLLNAPHRKVPEGERKYDWLNICTHPFAADVDDDGDLDILAGNVKNSAVFHENKGTADKFKFKDYGVTLFKFPDSKASPFFCDWDGDGDFDLLTGGGQGAVYLAINEGDKKKPDWKTFEEIISASETGGTMSKVCVHDWNNDSLLDVLVGTKTGNVSVFLQK